MVILDNMKFLDRFRKKKPTAKSESKAETKPKAPVKSAKELATEKGEAYINIISMDVNPDDISNGSFELDWNDKFIADLVRHGYMMDKNDTDADIVDRWFTAVCRNVVLETYEQYEAMDPQRDRVVKTRDIGDGLSEVS
jgi:hypothetical protein